jgi:Glycosyl transferases group 1
MKRLLFIRHYQAFTGGHLKVFHYVQHTLSSGFARPVVLLTADSSRNETNPFVALPDLIVTEPVQHDLLVLGGTDWEFAEKLGILSDRIPILNIIQNVRHARPDDPRRKWLRRAATRICVSQEVADAIISTGEVNGSVHVIPCGIPSLDHLRIAQADRSIDVFVAGLKDPLLAVAVASRLSDTGVASDVLLSSVDRNEYLRRMARARVAVLLTSELEGFFLPALEAMALEVAVVCPDTPGVRGLCRAEDNALVTARDPDAMVAATRRLLENQALCARIGARGRELAKVHTLQRERDDFLRVLSGATGPMRGERARTVLAPMCASAGAPWSADFRIDVVFRGSR